MFFTNASHVASVSLVQLIRLFNEVTIASKLEITEAS